MDSIALNIFRNQAGSPAASAGLRSKGRPSATSRLWRPRRAGHRVSLCPWRGRLVDVSDHYGLEWQGLVSHVLSYTPTYTHIMSTS